MLLSLLALVTVIAIAAAWLWPRNPYTPAIQHEVTVERLPGNPLIHAGLDEVLEAQASDDGYVNINWPSLIRVPDWIDNLSEVDMSPGDWNRWKASEGVDIMRPAAEWEGADLAVLPSLRGELGEEANAGTGARYDRYFSRNVFHAAAIACVAFAC